MNPKPVISILIGFSILVFGAAMMGWIGPSESGPSTKVLEDLSLQAKLNNRAVADLRREIEDLRDQKLASQARAAEGVVLDLSAPESEVPTVKPAPSPTPDIPAGTTLEDILKDDTQRTALRDQVYAWIGDRRKEDARRELESYLKMIQKQQNNKLLKKLKLGDEQKKQFQEYMKEYEKITQDLRSEKYAALDSGAPRPTLGEINKKLGKAAKEKHQKIKSMLTPEQQKVYSKSLRSDNGALNDPAIKLLQQQAQ